MKSVENATFLEMFLLLRLMITSYKLWLKISVRISAGAFASQIFYPKLVPTLFEIFSWYVFLIANTLPLQHGWFQIQKSSTMIFLSYHMKIFLLSKIRIVRIYLFFLYNMHDAKAFEFSHRANFYLSIPLFSLFPFHFVWF